MPNVKKVDAFRRATAKRLRANATGAEEKLWRALRRQDVEGTHFRRQLPIGSYVADFGSLSKKLLIEIDGSHHATPVQSSLDEKRTAWLEAEGYRVLRFWNSDLSDNLAGVLEIIRLALDGEPRVETKVHPTPTRLARRPSPSRGG